MKNPSIAGPRVCLYPFTADDISDRYLGWLNDPVVNRYSRRLGQETSLDGARDYLRSLPPNEKILAIYFKNQHVGNIKYSLDTDNRRCDIAILLGEISIWNQGVGSEAVDILTDHLFYNFNMNRVEAGTGNPAFLRLTEKLGWAVEGRQRERVRVGTVYLDWYLISILRQDWAREKRVTNLYVG